MSAPPEFPPPSTAPEPDWSAVRAEIDACGDRLVSAVRAAVSGLDALADQQEERLAARDGLVAPPPTLDAVASALETHRRELLEEPLARCRQLRPVGAILDACDEFERAVTRALGFLPPGLEAPEEASESVKYAFADERRRRRRLDGALAAAAGELVFDLVLPWYTVRDLLHGTGAADGPRGGIPVVVARMRARHRRHRRGMARALSGIERWCSALAETLVLRSQVRTAGGARRLAALIQRDDTVREFLQRQHRAIEADLDLELQLAACERTLLDAGRDLRAGVRHEHDHLLEELARALAWLEAWQPGSDASFPAPAVDVVPAVTRLRDFEQRAREVVDDLPATVEVPARLASAPSLLTAWTIQHPADLVRDSLAAAAWPVLGEGLTAFEQLHQGIVLEIERAREVVAFAREAGQADGEIEREGVENARSLLAFQQTQVHATAGDLDGVIVRGLAAGAMRAARLRDEGQFGVWRYAAREGLPRALSLVGRRSLGAGVTATGWVREAVERLSRAVLVAVGWMPAPAASGAAVVVARARLGSALDAEVTGRRLPQIYHRLFRLVPVDDPRFLIGRQDELQAIAAARQAWEEGRDASVLVVGARGSGKTSLINCAQQRVLDGLPVVRAEFLERLTRADELHEFLGRLLGVPAAAVEPALLDGRRVIVLEELERTFLREPGGFGAIQALLALIGRTSRRNLWIVSLNYASFRLLNAALRLEPYFSHRINAMAVEPTDLRDAILMRHTLSGLRLRFAAPPGPGPRFQHFLQSSGVPTGPEATLFEAIHRDSGGVFRTAFSLWQRHIERVEGGVLYMQAPVAPDYDGVVRALDAADLFTLTALLQHGSLTPAEHARIFLGPEGASRARFDTLVARDLIEPDPGRYGYRVVPDATEVVRRTLYRRNLG